jgi:hypothetical protein
MAREKPDKHDEDRRSHFFLFRIERHDVEVDMQYERCWAMLLLESDLVAAQGSCGFLCRVEVGVEGRATGPSSPLLRCLSS